METETNDEAARFAKIQPNVDRGVSKLDADLGPIWVWRVNLNELNLANAMDCVLGQLFGDYDDGLDALWPDAPIEKPHYIGSYCCKLCHGDSQEEFNVRRAQLQAENDAVTTRGDLSIQHGFIAGPEVCWYDDLTAVWTARIERLRQERPEVSA